MLLRFRVFFIDCGTADFNVWVFRQLESSACALRSARRLGGPIDCNGIVGRLRPPKQPKYSRDVESDAGLGFTKHRRDLMSAKSFDQKTGDPLLQGG
jgi:hypothetical protein